jgi:hypothetical protein
MKFISKETLLVNRVNFTCKVDEEEAENCSTAREDGTVGQFHDQGDNVKK